MAKTRSKSKIGINLKPDISQGELDVNQKRVVPGTVASAAETRAASRLPTSGIVARYLDRIQNSGMSDTERPDDGYIEQPRGNLPAVISRAITLSGGAIVPKWHQVKNLPGYMSSAIRAMGRAVFAPVTRTRIEDIYVVSTLSNRPIEVDAVGTWIMKNGKRNDQMKYRFHDLLPDYEASVDVWSVEGYTFVVVRDPIGKYIYGWPDSDNKVGPTRITSQR